ncbi:MAG TPA: hypothetical protein VE262_13800, partial [Blastocatellia bacterium]|nr:hypothetical protein [Blastocatellia bacterium]
MLSVVLRSMIVLLFAALLMIVGVSADSPEPANLTLRLSPELQEPGQEASAQSKHALPDNWKKVSSRIRRRVAQMTLNRARLQGGAQPDFSSYSDGIVRVRSDGRMRLTVRLSRYGAGEREELEKLGYEITFEGAQFRFLEGWLHFSQVEHVAGL